MNASPVRIPIRKSLSVTSIALACSLTAGVANAQVVVTAPADTTAITGATSAGFAAQLVKTYEEMQQLFSALESFTSGLSLPNTQLKTMSATDLISARCSANSGGDILGSLMNSLGSMLSQSVTTSQQQICAQIVMTQVDEYNKTVEMIKRVHSYQTQFQKLEDSYNKAVNAVAGLMGTSSGDSAKASVQAQDYDNALTTEKANYEAAMKADEAMIQTLESQQSLLAKLSLNGSPSLQGVAVQTAVFAAAFQEP